MPATRASITFIGRVQGVGFRATALAIAQQVGVTGWVRNEHDGSVQCVLEGSRESVDRFLEQVQSTMQRNIREVRMDSSSATGEFSGFRIIR